MISRQLEMIYILMNKGTVTAEELAAHFEVSVRTIYRDVESLSMAGFPVYAGRGKGGGIRLMERFVLDKLLLYKEEQNRILAALISLQETGAYGDEKILKKLETFFRTEPVDWVSIDFSDWSGRRGELFGQIKEAILGRHVIEFDYYGQHGEMSHRQAEPVQLLFKEYTWYVRAWCRKREAMRLFKVLRMKRVEVLEEIFETGERHREEEVPKGCPKEQKLLPKPGEQHKGKPEIPEGRVLPEAAEEGAVMQGIPEGSSRETREYGMEPSVMEAAGVESAVEASGAAQEEASALMKDMSTPWERQKNDGSVICKVVFQVDKKEAYRVYDRFEEDEITVLPQGDFEIGMCCTVDDWVYGLILSFGASARVLSPEWVRKEIEERIRLMAQVYKKADIFKI